MNMGCCNREYHEFNLDWFIKEFRGIKKEVEEIENNIKEFLANLSDPYINACYPPGNLDGLIGDGVTDNTDKLQKIINYACEKHRRIIIPSGEYVLNAGVTIPDGWITIEGEQRSGTHIILGGGTLFTAQLSESDYPNFLCVKDIYITPKTPGDGRLAYISNTSYFYATGVRAYNLENYFTFISCQAIRLFDCKFENNNTPSLENCSAVNMSGNCVSSRFENCDINFRSINAFQNTRGITYNYGMDLYISNCGINGCDTGIEFIANSTAPGDLNITECYFDDCHGYGIHALNVKAKEHLVKNSGSIIANNYFACATNRSVVAALILLENCQGFVVANNVLLNLHNAEGHEGIYCTSLLRSVISNNLIQNMDQYSIRIAGGTALTVRGNNISSLVREAIGIVLANIHGSSIGGNVLSGMINTAINITVNSTFNVIKDNCVSPDSAYTGTFNNQGTDNTVSDNIIYNT